MNTFHWMDFSWNDKKLFIEEQLLNFYILPIKKSRGEILIKFKWGYIYIIGTRRLFLKRNFKESPIIKNCHNDYCTQEALNRHICRVQTLARDLRLKRHKCPHVESNPWPCAPLFSASNTPGFIFSAFPAPWSSSWVVEQLMDLEAVAFFVVWLCTRPTTWAPFIQTEASQGLDYSTSAQIRLF